MNKSTLYTATLVLFSTALSAYPAPPFTDLKVASAKRGNTVDRAGSYSGAGYSEQVRKTDRVMTIQVEYKTLRDFTGAYEIQCFFIARDPGGEKFVYDAYKYSSKEKDKKFNIMAKELYGGTKTRSYSTSTEPITGTTTSGNTVTGTLTTTIFTRSVREGSKCVGWVVRLFYDGEFVRQQASLSELDQMAKNNADELTDIANKLSLSAIPLNTE